MQHRHYCWLIWLRIEVDIVNKRSLFINQFQCFVFLSNFFSGFENFRYRDPCSASIDEDDLHTTKLVGDPQKRVSISFNRFMVAGGSKQITWLAFFFFRFISKKCYLACSCNLAGSILQKEKKKTIKGKRKENTAWTMWYWQEKSKIVSNSESTYILGRIESVQIPQPIVWNSVTFVIQNKCIVRYTSTWKKKKTEQSPPNECDWRALSVNKLQDFLSVS